MGNYTIQMVYNCTSEEYADTVERMFKSQPKNIRLGYRVILATTKAEIELLQAHKDLLVDKARKSSYETVITEIHPLSKIVRAKLDSKKDKLARYLAMIEER